MNLSQATLVETRMQSFEGTLDERLRLRLPNEMVDGLLDRLEEAGVKVEHIGGQAQLAFYLAPGPGGRIYIYPEPNYAYAVHCVENPPKHLDRQKAQKIRRFFYAHVKRVECDNMHRLVIPERLREYAGIDNGRRNVSLTAQRYFIELATEEILGPELTEIRPVFDEDGQDVLAPFESDAEPSEAPDNGTQ